MSGSHVTARHPRIVLVAIVVAVAPLRPPLRITAVKPRCSTLPLLFKGGALRTRTQLPSSYERLGWRRIETTQHDDGQGHAVDAYCYVGPPK